MQKTFECNNLTELMKDLIDTVSDIAATNKQLEQIHVERVPVADLTDLSSNSEYHVEIKYS